MRTTIAFLVCCSCFASPAWCDTRTVKLELPTMDCPVCPITVRQALKRVPGVGEVQVNYERREAIVTFDDARTTTDALMRATRDVGYPSKAVEAAR